MIGVAAQSLDYPHKNVTAWIDFNQDGDFVDAGEKVGVAVERYNSNVTFNFVVPSTAVLGQTRLRIIEKYNSEATEPCPSNYTGEAEDYLLTIIAGCNGTPTAGVASSTSVGPLCANTPFTLSVSPAPVSLSDRYQWQVSTVGASGPFTNINGATGGTLTINNQTITSWYRFTDTCFNSGLGVATNVVNVASVINTNSCLTYCIPEYSGNYYSYINSVKLESINNVSGRNESAYTSYVNAPTPTQTTNLTQGTTKTITINLAEGGSFHEIGAWIDFNGDGDFGDAGEKLGALSLQSDGDVQMTFSIPAGATIGYTRLRVRLRGNPFNPGMDPCESFIFDYGEVEDYPVYITAPCVQPVVPIITAGGPTTFCQGNTVTLTASGAATYLWNNGATTASIQVTTGGSYTVRGYTATGCNGLSTATVVTVTARPAQPTLACYQTATFDIANCSWVVTGTQPVKPANVNCWDNYQFNTTSCTWVNMGTQPLKAANVNCWDNYQFNTTNCTWVNTGTQPVKPTNVNCWDNYQFNTTSCTWVNMGTQPVKPANVNCWDNYQFNTTNCTWVNTGTQPVKPANVNCWDNYQFNTTSCTWVNMGTQPVKPVNVNCWDNYQFNATNCAWENTGVQPARPTTGCYLQATFNTETCQWVVPAAMTYYRDADSDGFGNPVISMQSCTPLAGYVTNNNDCDDTKAAVNPNTMWYKDADNDNYYTGVGIRSCVSPGVGYRYSGLVAGGDCNDANANIRPGATEICGNGIDDNCDGQVDEGCNNKAMLTITDATVYESAGTVTLTVNLSKKVAQSVSFNYKTVDGTAKSKAKPNSPADYMEKSGTIIIPANVQTATITITIISDNIVEAAEQFTVELSKPSNAGIDKGVGVVTILDGAPFAGKGTYTVAEQEWKKVPATNDEQFSAKVMPNPSSSEFTVTLTGKSEELVQVLVMDVAGRIVERRVDVPSQGTMRLGAGYKAGFYLVEITSGKQRQTLKLIKL